MTSGCLGGGAPTPTCGTTMGVRSARAAVDPNVVDVVVVVGCICGLTGSGARNAVVGVKTGAETRNVVISL